MNKEECDVLHALVFFIAFGALCFFGGYIAGNFCGEERGYCQALADIEAGKKPLYELKKQEDGTTKWEVRSE